MMFDKDVLSQCFGEQVSNLIIGADREKFNLPMTDVFMNMMTAYVDMLCLRSTCIILKHLTEHMRCITNDLEVMIPDLCYQVHD